MERIEPTLIPQWLKGTGNVTGGGTTLHQTSSSSFISDDHTIPKHARNRQANVNGHDIGRSYNSDRTTSSYFRRSSSSNGSGRRSQSNFGTSSRDREWERDKYDSKDKDKSILGDFRRCDYSDPFDNILPSRVDKDLRRSQSLITGKRGESSPRKVSSEFNNNKINHGNSNGLLAVSSLINTVQKTAFERDFPSLGADERQSASEVRRVSSPGLTTAIQTLPVVTSTILGGDGWTSALAEVPVIVGSGGPVGAVVQQSITSTAASITPSTTGVLNMAETVAHGPTRANNVAQQPVGNQRLEELVLKQSRQLIPVVPAMSKNPVLNPPEKSKAKTSQPQQNQSALANLSPRASSVKPDFPRTSMVGKLHVLKPSRERNGSSVPHTTTKDGSSTPIDSKVAGVGAVLSSSSSSPVRSPIPPILEKRLTQARSRNDFFNLVRKNSMPTTPSSVCIETIPSEVVAADSPIVKQSGEMDSPSLDGSVRNTSLKKVDEENNYVKTLYSEEEEAAFLRSLGWEEKNNGEDEGLTEEEISAFYKHVDEYIKQQPTSRTSQKIQPKLFGPRNSSISSDDGTTCSGSSSSDSKAES